MNIDQLIEHYEQACPQLDGKAEAEFAHKTAQALRLLNDVYEAAKGVSWPGPMLEKAIAAAQEKVDE